MQNYRVRLARHDEQNAVMQFISKEWKENHILGVNKEFFYYQYATNENYLNVVIAKNHETQEIDCVLGFIPSSNDMQSIWLALWKTRSDVSAPNLGMACLNYLIEYFNVQSISCNGINDKTKVIYKFLGYHVEKMKHYYLPNPQISRYKLAYFDEVPVISVPKLSKNTSLFGITDINQFKTLIASDIFHQTKPDKDISYFQWRYFEHPIYKYELFAIESDKKISCIFVLREVMHGESKVLRIVDIIGDESEMEKAGAEIIDMLISRGGEYIDCVAFGLKLNSLEKAGFILKSNQNKAIIPEYFSPFEQKNITVHIFTNILDNFRMFKADGDQDRPNIVN